MGEINLIPLFGRRYNSNKISPYILGGVSVFNFNPKTLYQDNWINLQPLGTEGQGLESKPEKYRLTQIAINYGLGLKYKTENNFSISIELSPRLTFTDYLDDVSTNYVDANKLEPLAAELSDRSDEIYGEEYFTTNDIRGNPNRNDVYIFTGVTIAKRFNMCNPRNKCMRFLITPSTSNNYLYDLFRIALYYILQ